MKRVTRKGAKLVIETASSNKDAQAFIDMMAVIVQPYLNNTSTIPSGLADKIKLAVPYATKMSMKTLISAVLSSVPMTGSYQAADKFNDAVYFLCDKYRKNTKMLNDKDLTSEDLRFLKAAGTFWRTESDPSLKATKDLAGKVVSNGLRPMFAASVSSNSMRQADIVETLRDVVQELTGVRGVMLSKDQADTFRENQPELYAKYRKIRREVLNITKETINNMTRKTGPVTIQHLIKELDKLGIINNLPSTFVGKIDERGYYTIFDEVLDGTPVGDVVMNPAYKRGSTEYVCKYKALGAKNYQMLYTLDSKKLTIETKFKKVANTVPLIEEAQRKWLKDIKATDPQLKQIAMIMEIIYLCQARVGTVGNEAEGKPTFGITTILAKHCKLTGNKLVIQYPGKKGTIQKHVITKDDLAHKKIIEYIVTRKEESKPNDRIWSVSARDVNKYITTKLKLPISAHKFRTLRGTVLMDGILKAAKIAKNATPKKINEVFMDAALRVGKQLGHANKTPDGGTKITGTTAIQSYISPEVMADFYNKYDVRPPATVERVLRKANLMG